MSSLAQEESRSISENVTWGQRKRMADGKISLPYAQFLGYKKGEDGLPKIVESEAEIVRMMFHYSWRGKHRRRSLNTWSARASPRRRESKRGR